MAAALAASDPNAIGRALRHDVVVVPLLVEPDGSVQMRVSIRDGRPALGVYSSTQTLRAAFPDEPGIQFALQLGTDLSSFLQRYRGELAHVVFDSAGPHPMQASVDDVIALLAPHPGDDPVAWVTGEPSTAVQGVDVTLAPPWVMLDSDPRARADQLAGLASSTELSGRRGRGIRAWLDTLQPRPGARGFAVFIERSGLTVIAMSLEVGWHLGEQGEPGSSIDNRTDGTVAVEHVLPIPDGSGICRLTFTSPDPTLIPVLLPRMAAIAAGVRWVRSS